MKNFSFPAAARVALLACLIVALSPSSSARGVVPPVPYQSAGAWPRTTWQLSNPKGMATDRSGNTYVADTGNNRIVKFDVYGRQITSWGGAGGENGRFKSPWDVACDPTGQTVYVADTLNHRVQKFSVDGRTVRYVGKWGREGSPDLSGSNPGEFNEPHGLALDGAGNVFVVDTKNYRIQKFSPSGTPLTQWGTAGSDVDKFLEPWAIDISPSGWVYVLDTNNTNNYVRAFDLNGLPVSFTTGGNGWGVAANPEGIAVDDDGNVYVSQNSILARQISKYDAEGELITTWGVSGYGDVDRYGVPAFRGPCGLDASGAGASVRVMVADSPNDRIREFSGDGSPLMRRDSYGVLGSHGEALWRFDEPWDVAEGPTGTIYVADRFNHRVERLTSTGDLIAATPDVIPPMARVDNGYFNEPAAVAYDSVSQFVFAAEVGNNRIQRLTSDLIYEGHKWGAKGTALGTFDKPQGIAVGPSPTGGRWVYVSDTGNNRVQVFELDGTPKGQIGLGSLLAPAGIVVTDSGVVYVVDSGHKRVVSFTPGNATWTAWTAGPGFGATGSGDALLSQPWGLANDDLGDLYVTDIGAHKVKKFTSTGSFITSFGAQGSARGQLESPRGVVVNAEGVVYVADTTNDRFQAFVTPVEITIDYPADLGAYNTTVSPSFSIGPGAVTSGAELDGTAWASAPIGSEGVHVFRVWAKDVHGLVHEKVAQFVIDLTPPVTVDNIQTPYSNAGIINLVGMDGLSGVGATYWRMDGGPIQTGTSLAVSQYGAHVLEYWSVDQAGNEEFPHNSKPFTLADTVPPVTASDVVPTYFGKAVITLSPTDTGSGVAETTYRLDAGAPTAGTVVTVTGLGSHSLEFHSVDAAGNTETTKTVAFTVNTPDTVPPVTTSNAVRSYFGKAVITLSPTDTGSGVAETTYRLDAGAPTAGTVVTVTGLGSHSLEFHSVDRAGNSEGWKTATFTIAAPDTTPPTTMSNAVRAYSDRAVITLSPTDTSSGVAETMYRLDAGVPTVGRVVTVTELGSHSLQFRSTDKVGNLEGWKLVIFRVKGTTSVAVSRDSSPVGYGGTAATNATLRMSDGARLKGTLKLYRSSNGKNWSYVKSVTSSTGVFSHSTVLYGLTHFKWAYGGDSLHTAAAGQTLVDARARLPKPVAPSKARKKRSTRVYGDLKPRHVARSKCITIRAYRREHGKYVYKKSARFAVLNRNSYSRYSGRFIFPSAGKWRVRAYHNDTDHAASYSAYDYVTVK